MVTQELRFSRLKICFLCMVVFSLMLHSCYLEKKYGREFARNAPNISLLILEPDLILKSDIRTPPEDSLNVSRFIKNLPEDTISAIFTSQVIEQLQKLGVKVIRSKQMSDFFTMKPPAYLFNIAQTEIEQYSYPVKEKYTTDSIIYTQEFLLHAVNLNTWLEFTELNSDKKAETLFSNFFVKDNISGDFRVNLLTDEVTYVYERKDLSPDDIMLLISHAGKTNAHYIFNMLMNKYIADKMQDRFNKKYFYYYDPVKKKVRFLENYTEFKKLN